MSKPMTNYNGRLDDVVSLVGVPLPIEQAINAKDTAKQAITSLIKELVAEAKPEIKAHPLGPVTLADCQRGLDQFEQNLLKALEEV